MWNLLAGMPDVSVRPATETGLRPRVSFNRDVHVKRFGPRSSVATPTSNCWTTPPQNHIGNLHPCQHVTGEGRPSTPTVNNNTSSPSTNVRRQRLTRSKSALEKEAAAVLQQVGQVHCVTAENGVPPQYFYTLPLKHTSEDLKSANNSDTTQFHRRNALKLKRSISDASDFRSRKPSSRAAELVERTAINTETKSNLIVNKENNRNLDNYSESTSIANGGTFEGYTMAKKSSPVVHIINVERATGDDLSNKRISGSSSTNNNQPPFTSTTTPPSSRYNFARKPLLHSSQQPVDRLPLTRGYTVDPIVNYLNTTSSDGSSPPSLPKNPVQAPTGTHHHNGNQPFSYTTPTQTPSPSVLYAQVLKKPRPPPQSDSDEGLGGDDDSGGGYRGRRGRGDGMDDLSTRRDLLESRIHWWGDKLAQQHRMQKTTLTLAKRPRQPTPPSPQLAKQPPTNAKPTVVANSRLKSSYYYKSTPDIYRSSLQAEEDVKSSKADDVMHTSDGIDEVDFTIKRYRDEDKNLTGGHHQRHRQRFSTATYFVNHASADSEDEGFASSFQIANGRLSPTKQRILIESKDVDYGSSGDNNNQLPRKKYHHRHQVITTDYVPRERCIDDGTYFDPRLDRDYYDAVPKAIEHAIRIESKPPKPESKKSGLDKVKKLFTRESKSKRKDTIVKSDSTTGGEVINGGKENSMTTSNYNDYYTNSGGAKDHFKSTIETDPFSHHQSATPHQRTEVRKPTTSTVTKTLRFFGDTTDVDSDVPAGGGTCANAANGNPRRLKSALKHNDRAKSQSSRDLHVISEEAAGVRTINSAPHCSGGAGGSDGGLRRRAAHKSLNSLHQATLSTSNGPSRRCRRDREESSTEGESSQHSQRSGSVVYLHAATVGDIPSPVAMRRSQYPGEAAPHPPTSAAAAATPLGPKTKRISRSFSVLAPWSPRTHKPPSSTPRSSNQHYQMQRDMTSANRHHHTSTLGGAHRRRRVERAHHNNKNNHTNGRSCSSSNNRSGAATGYSHKSQSVESLEMPGGDSWSYNKRPREPVCRSHSMPRNPEKTSGWYTKY